jgi:hypothetical protein
VHIKPFLFVHNEANGRWTHDSQISGFYSAMKNVIRV